MTDAAPDTTGTAGGTSDAPSDAETEWLREENRFLRERLTEMSDNLREALLANKEIRALLTQATQAHLTAPTGGALTAPDGARKPTVAPARPTDRMIHGLGASGPGPLPVPSHKDGPEPSNALQKFLRWLRE